MKAQRHTSVVGFIGAGNMGGAVARNLARRGWAVQVYDPDSTAVRACSEAGATACTTLEGAVQDATHVVTSLPTPEILRATVEETLAVAPHGTTIVDISTIDPDSATALEDRCRDRGARFVAAPLGKGPAQAETGDIPLFVGGDAATLDTLDELFADLGTEAHRMGSVQAATTFKVISNLLGMTNLAVLAEGLAMARRAGIADDVFDAALKQTGAASYQQQVRMPWILDADWSPRFGVDLALKDMRLAIDAAWRWKIALPVGSAAVNQYAAASSRGCGQEDVIAVVKVTEPGI